MDTKKINNELFKNFFLLKEIREINKLLNNNNSNQLYNILSDFMKIIIYIETINNIDYETVKEKINKFGNKFTYNNYTLELELQELTQQYIIHYYNAEQTLPISPIFSYHYNPIIFKRFLSHYSNMFLNDKKELIENKKLLLELIEDNEFEHIFMFFLFIGLLFDKDENNK